MRYLLLSLSCAATLLWGANASCYYPDGSFPEDYVYAECSEEENTGCCILSEGDQCLSNGLCYDPSSQYLFRGGCSDKSWNSTNCFQHCKTGDSTSTYDPLVPCGDNRYCCSSEGSTCCNDDSKVFTVGAATVIKDLASTGAFSIPIETPTALPTSDPETTAEAEPTAEPTAEPKETSKNARPSGTSKQTGSAAASTSTSTSPAGSEAESESSGLSKTALIAIAVAGVVVLLLAIGLVWFLVRRRYRKKIAAGTNPQSFPMASEGFQKLPDKSPRPVEVPVPMQSPAPPYQPPAYGAPMATYGAPHPPMNGAVEIGHFDGPPGRGPNGQVVYEAPAQNYHR